jgi:hypothetical protein
MKKRMGLAVLASICLALSATALDVAETEVSAVQAAAIEFINYEGPHDVVETAEQIRGIGRSLGSAVARGLARSGEVGRYMVIHAVDPAVKPGFDADIIILGEGARVDHIKNLRRIVAGYLESAYGYSARDADTLSVFITIYNAVYRGKIDYFSGKYKPVVMAELTPEHAGLSVRWDEWAGRSRIVIPLTSRAGAGVLGSIDTTSITDKPTIESLKEESPTAGVEERRDVVDLKERGQEEEKVAIDAEKARIAGEEAAIAAEKSRIEAEKAGIAGTAGPGATAPGADAAPGASGETAGDRTTAAVAGDTGADAVAKGADQEASIAVSEKAREEEAAVAAREAQVEADKAAVAAREEASAAKDAEIAADRAAIAGDQKEAIKEEVTAAADKEANAVPLFELVDPNLPFSRLVLVDLKAGEVLRKSTLNTIKANTSIDTGDAFIAVAGQVTGAGGAVRLVRIAKADYADVVQGKEDVFADTMLWKIGSSIYAVVKKDAGWAIGRFDPATLELKASSAPVTRWTSVAQSGGRLVAQGPSGGFLILEAEALTTASEIKR